LCLALQLLCAWADGAPLKLALVIGNQNYGIDKSLPNALNDARLMAKTLSRLGFDVTERHNLTKDDMVSAMTEFSNRIPAGATAMVYYAGHGMQVAGSTYLNPVDMPISSELKTPLRSYALQFLLDRLAFSRSAVNIVVLDACRNNPFRQQAPTRYRSFSDLGLSKVHAPRGTVVAYSTAPGQLAADGTGSNSVYTLELSRMLVQPGLEIEEIFKQVGTGVRRKTLDDQIPWYESSLTDKYYFQPPAGVEMVAGKTLHAAPTGNAEAAGLQRKTAIPVLISAPWFRQMDAAGWSQVDWEIQQQRKSATADQIALLTHKANAGNVLAQTTLGLVYRDGIEGVHIDNTRAAYWLGKAAVAGFPVAQAELGEMYFSGHGVVRNLGNSRKWLQQAGQAEYPRAQLDLLHFDLESDPAAVPVDLSAAMKALFTPVRVAPMQSEASH